MLKNLKCKPGAYVEIVPIGLLCTLQFNENGILQKAILGFDSTNYLASDVLKPALTLKLKELNKVPQRIPFSHGITWIKGIFYSSELFKKEGILPDCVQKDILRDLEKKPEDYTFYAADLVNDSYSFVGGPMITTRLATFGFNVLPGYQVFDEMSELPIEQIMKSKKSPFVFPYISGILVYDTGKESVYQPANLSQRVVTNIEEKLDTHGFLLTKVSMGSYSIFVSYTTIVKYNIVPKSIVILDGDTVIGSRKPASIFSSAISRDKNCPICHKKMVIPHSGHSYCSDDHCVSRMYPHLSHFLRVLNLPLIDFDDYLDYIREKSITCLTDIFTLAPYDTAIVDCTLSNLLYAAIPFETCRGVDFFQKFVNNLGSIEALDYYLTNPDTIISDLHLNKMQSQNFVNWIKDPSNLLTLRTLISMEDHIRIQPVDKKFDGDPIFRGKTICLTGNFRRGTLEDIISILQSYSARVVTSFDNTVNCVILGHFEGEDSQITNLALSYNIPIYSEDDFFAAYQIDLDVYKQAESH